MQPYLLTRLGDDLAGGAFPQAAAGSTLDLGLVGDDTDFGCDGHDDMVDSTVVKLVCTEDGIALGAYGCRMTACVCVCCCGLDVAIVARNLSSKALGLRSRIVLRASSMSSAFAVVL